MESKAEKPRDSREEIPLNGVVRTGLSAKADPLIYDLLRAFFPHHIMSLCYYSGEEFSFRNHEELENSNPLLPVKETLKTGFVASSVWRIHLLGETVLMNRIREV